LSTHRENRMRPFRPQRLGLAVLVQAALVTLILMPTLWLSRQAPTARSIALPALGLLALALLLANEAPPRPAKDGTRGRAGRTEGCSLHEESCSVTLEVSPCVWPSAGRYRPGRGPGNWWTRCSGPRSRRPASRS